MCPPKIKTPEIPVVEPAEMPVYGTPPEPEQAPKLTEDPTKTSHATASVRSKRRGISALRTDLGIPDKANAGSGLQIPS